LGIWLSVLLLVYTFWDPEYQFPVWLKSRIHV